MILVKVTAEYAEQIREYRKEFLDCGDSMDGCGSLRIMDDPYEYIKKCIDYEKAETVPEGRVQATQFIFLRESDSKIVGMIHVRHYFNDYLSKYGGHIGYSVRPTERRKGYAKKMLRSILPFCHDIGLDNILITCYDTNEASEKTILSCGGVYESTVYEPNDQAYLKRFWINIK